METRMNVTRAIVTFLVGGAMGVGAACLMSRACAMRKSNTGGSRQKPGEVPTQPATPYCAVPEGADICFPEQ
ncbi:MAG: hypothetical protein ABSC19_16445 [Syntrophorhabdales bacterium]|jgi:hypothetical protein